MIGDFKLGKIIGKGTFGEVHMAKHIPSGQCVAIKVLKKKKILKKSDLKLIQTEISILLSLNHPNIPKLLQLHEDHHQIYIVTELAKGQELYELIVKKQSLSVEQSLSYFAQLVGILNYLHEQGICHRDIKPENIIIEGNSLKLIDFGLSNWYPQNTMISTSCGSPCYAAPQMFKQQKYNVNLVDVWALGITFYTMLSGKLPFYHTNIKKMHKMIQKGHYPPIQGISQQVQHLLSRMIEPCPSKRINMALIKQHQCLYPYANFMSKSRHQYNHWNLGLLQSMEKMFQHSVDDLKKIIQLGKISSIWTYYQLLKNCKSQINQQIEQYEGPIHLNYLFKNYKSLCNYVKLYMQNCEWKSKSVLKFKDMQIIIKKIKYSKNLFYLQFPFYFSSQNQLTTLK